MYGRILPTTVILALGAGVPVSHAAPSNWVGVGAPKSARTGKPFPLKASASYDWRLYAPPRRYLAAGVFRRRSDDPCPRSVPLSSGRLGVSVVQRGWEWVGRDDFTPRGGIADELSTEFLNRVVTLRTPGAYRHCGYVYEIRYRPEISSKGSYHVLAKSSALTRVRRR